LLSITPYWFIWRRNLASNLASSAKRSIKINLAPSRASLVSEILCSGFKYFCASFSGVNDGCENKLFANGSKPASIAIWPFVRRLALNGRYKSSNSVLLLVAFISCSNCAVSLSCSLMVFNMNSRLSSRVLK
jgi:hypothetical protein